MAYTYESFNRELTDNYINDYTDLPYCWEYLEDGTLTEEEHGDLLRRIASVWTEEMSDFFYELWEEDDSMGALLNDYWSILAEVYGKKKADQVFDIVEESLMRDLIRNHLERMTEKEQIDILNIYYENNFGLKRITEQADMTIEDLAVTGKGFAEYDKLAKYCYEDYSHLVSFDHITDLDATQIAFSCIPDYVISNGDYLSDDFLAELLATYEMTKGAK